MEAKINILNMKIYISKKSELIKIQCKKKKKINIY